MSIHQHGILEDTMYFWFAANDTSGSGTDGATPVYDVRLAGASAGAAPVLSDTATLLTHGDFPAGAHEVAVAATTGNGFAAGETYSVFCTLLVDSQNPTGFIGSFTLGPVVADIRKILGTAPTEGGAGRLAGSFTKLYDVATPTLVASDVMRGTDTAATAAKLLAYVQLLARSDAAIETDNGTELTEINADGGSGGGDFSSQADAVEALRDRGDAAWTTGAGGTGLSALGEGTAQSGTASTIVLAGASTFADDVLNGNVINILSGTGAGQSRVIVSNTLSDDTCNIYPNWATNPSSDSNYEIVQGSANISMISLDGPAADNLESAAENYSVTRGLTGTALPAVAADGVGGLPISDAGGLDLDMLLGTLATLAAETRSANVLDQLKTIIAVIESQRGHHTHQPSTGVILFIDEVNGATTGSGATGGVSDPISTHLDAETVYGTDYGHDLYIFVAGAVGGMTTHTEVIVPSKGYSLLRGPGRDLLMTRAGNGPTFGVTADGVEISGMQIASPGASATSIGVLITAVDFAAVHNCWLLDTQGDAIHISRGSNCQIYENKFDGSGVAASGQAIHISGAGGAGNADENVIRNNMIANSVGDAIIIDDGTTDSTTIRGNSIRGSGGWGISLTVSSDSAHIYENRLASNATGNIDDGGTNTTLQDNVALDPFELGAIWIDTVNGVAGTEYPIGTEQQQSSTLAVAKTIADAHNITRFEVGAGSALTFATDMDGYTIDGSNYSIDFNGQDSDSLRLNGATVSGTLTASGSIGLLQCRILNATSLPSCGMSDCTMVGDIVFTGTFYLMNECKSVDSPSISLENGSAQTVFAYDFDGDLEVKSMKAGDSLEFTGGGHLTIASDCTGGTITLRKFTEFTDNVAGGFVVAGGVINDETRYEVSQITVGVSAALEDIHLDHLLAVDYDPTSKPGVATALFNELIVNDAGVSQYSTNALERAPGGTSSLTVTVSPIAGSIVNRFTSPLITLIQFEHILYGPWVITDSDGDPVDLSGLQLAFVVYDDEGDATELWRLTTADGELPISGDDNNQITLTDDATNTQDDGQFRYTLWDTTNSRPLQRDVLRIERSSGPIAPA